MKRKTQPAIAFVKPPPFRDAMKRVTKELRCDNPTCDCVGDLFYAKAENARLKRARRALRKGLRECVVNSLVLPAAQRALEADTRAARRKR